MKKSNLKLWTMVLTAILVNIQIVSGQKVKEKAAPMPDEISKIFSSKCTPCHWTDGKFMALTMVNFSNWTKYSEAKGSKKASMICYTLNKGKMPPKKTRKKTPEIVPTKEQLDLICKWAESLKEGQKKP